MASDLQDAKMRVGYCYGQITVLAAEIDRFIASGAHAISQDVDSATGGGTFFIELTKPLPKLFSIQAGLIAHEMRATLDELACVLAARNGQSADKVYFCVARDKTTFEKDGIRNKLKKLSPKDQGTMASFKPWADGNPLLHALHAIDLTRKHQRLIVTATGIGSLGIVNGTVTSLEWLGTGSLTAGQRQPFMRVGKGTFLEANLGLDINFAEPTAIKGRPVAVVLRDFAALTKSIIESFD
ncbi:MAG: hypothetical protein EOP22_14655 [Hyphomicrobiales bacterium]|nr:MAG: hypothetical protein EOP22_14655 [Hyphomicrobiales bacterium]